MDVFQAVFAGAFGLFFGSFFGVLIDRIPRGESILWGRSHCDFCKKPLRWFELIPVVSFIMQRGRCKRCKKRLSASYPAIELATALLFILIVLLSPLPIIDFVLFPCLLLLFVTDLKYEILPDVWIGVACIAAITRLIFLTGISGDLLPYLLSAVGAMVFFWSIWAITHGKGMGFGDVKLAFFIGLLLGYPLTLIGLFGAFLTGAIVGVILIIAAKKRMKSHVPFGPFLLASTLVVFLFAQPFLSLWYTYWN